MKKERKEKGYVLASVYNKKGIAKLVKTIKQAGFSVMASEGTGKTLAKHDIPFISAEQSSLNPKKLRDCIKTISFQIEAGIMFDRKNNHQIREAKSLNIKPIDIVICNFPPFKQVIKKKSDFNARNIDVGGPLMVRAAATNLKNVLIITDTADYKKVADLISKDEITPQFRQQMAQKAFEYTRNYDEEIISYLKKIP